ncbi:MAG: MFS transporter [Candidatus Zixiibacteriota bacterium]|nr:MAG: MFS transporter [candidate division Zixibacteria bacterium]
MHRRRFLIHSLAHAVNDLYSGFLAPLLPLLAARHGLSLAGAGLLVTLQTLAASLSQPLWGMLSDRWRSPWYIPGGILVAGVFLSLIGVAPSVFVLVMVILIGGLGVASFHPLGAALAAALAGRRKGLAIALFITAGSTGYAFGPVLISALVGAAGLQRTWMAVFPALVMVTLWLTLGPKVRARDSMTPALVAAEVGKDPTPPILWRAITLLSATSTVRAFVMLSFLNFLPFLLKEQGLGLGSRSLYLFTLQFGDALGNLIGGGLSDRLGRRRIMLWSPLLSIPLLAVFLHTSGPLALLPLFLAGIVLFASAPAVVVSSQKLMPGREGLASALQVGFAWGLAGLFMSLVGKAGEIFTIRAVLGVILGFPLLMTLFAWGLKRYGGRLEA